MRGSRLAEKPSNSSWANLPNDYRPRVVRAVVLLVAGWVEAVVGDNVNTISGQDLAVGVLVAGAGVESCVSQLQALNQQPPLHVKGAVVVVLRKLRAEERATKRQTRG